MATSKSSRPTMGVYSRSSPLEVSSLTTRDCAGAMPWSISNSTRSVTPRASPSSFAHATSKRLWLAIPIRTAEVRSGVSAQSTHRLKLASTSSLDE